MTTTTTTTTTTLHSYFSYRDAPAALDWLSRAFGFETTMRYDDPDTGVLAHAEARLGDAGIIVFSDDGADYTRPAPRDEACGQGAYVTVPDEATVDTVWARAIEAGATPVWKPERTEWNYRCRVRDLEGYEWTFAIHKPGVPQEW